MGINFIHLSMVICILRHAKSQAVGGYWWNLGVLSSRNPQQIYMVGSKSDMCSKLSGLSMAQIKLCMQYSDHMLSVARGALIGIKECQYQFLSGRWNCSTNENDANVFGSVATSGFRETAFIHGVSSAGVAYSIARSCREGQLSKCQCSDAEKPKNLNPEWTWGGCGDNILYGIQFTQQFVDSREKEKNYPRHSNELLRMLMNLHNNEAGRRAVYRNSQVACKCHGVSGSCSLKTCWQQLPAFRDVGNTLRQLYDRSVEVRFNPRGARLQRRLSESDRARNTSKGIDKNDLVFIDESPDYCTRNTSIGYMGTTGRECQRGAPGPSGCAMMCCGRGFSTKPEVIKTNCMCKFFWCCEVTCRTCPKRVDKYICN